MSQHPLNTDVFTFCYEDTWYAWNAWSWAEFRRPCPGRVMIPSSTVWTFALQEYSLVSLVPEPKPSSPHLFPGDTGHTELCTFSAANCWAVSPCTAHQLETSAFQGFLCPHIYQWLHLQKAWWINNANKATVCSWWTPGQKYCQDNHIITDAADQTGLYGCQKDTWMLQQNKKKKTGTCCTGLGQLYLKDLEVLWYIEGD